MIAERVTRRQAHRELVAVIRAGLDSAQLPAVLVRILVTFAWLRYWTMLIRHRPPPRPQFERILARQYRGARETAGRMWWILRCGPPRRSR